MNLTRPVKDFMAAIERAGLNPPESIIVDGKLHRFATNGKQDDDSGWYVFHADGVPTGAFGDWRTGIKQTWTGKPEQQMTASERKAHQRRMGNLKRQREEEEKLRHVIAAQRAQQIWDAAEQASDDHPYLLSKQVGAHNVRIDGHSLIIPLRDIDDRLWTLEFIQADGTKRFLADGKKREHFFLLGTIKEVLCLVEGYATGASVFEATGYAVAISFDAGNIIPVAQTLRAKYPNCMIVVCGDEDIHVDGGPNIGREAATEAAIAIDGVLAMPPILSGKKTDFNDLATAKGIKAVSETIDVALAAHRTGSIPSGDDAHLHTYPALASDPNILARFEDDVQQCGVVGEVRGAKLLFLILVSRVLAEPVSVVVKGLSSSGKSYMTEKTLKFFPPSAYIAMTAMSERALVYMNEDFKHRTLVIYEATALSEERERTEGNLTAYFVRSLLSEGRLSYKVTVRAPGGFATKSIDKEGPTNLILTTTYTELHGENETRLLSIPTNDTQEQTKAIMKRLAQGHHADMDFRGWHALQEWLLRAEHCVVIPYAGYLAEQIPPVAVRLRRDFKSLLRLIEAHAILHQCTRARDESGRILANKDDYLAVRGLIADLVASGVGATVPETMRTTVEAVRNATGPVCGPATPDEC
jgi:phage/plasmid primase-like uncharacterized protein